MKKIKNPFDWYPAEHWHWPEGDKKLVQVLEWADDIEYIMSFVDKPVDKLCIQAGGAVGVWPIRFAQYFLKVYTFEPLRENCDCLMKNIYQSGEAMQKITPFQLPLSHTGDKQRYSIESDVFERENFGAGYIVPDPDGMFSRSIDGIFKHLWPHNPIGLIQLDIEGSELNALQGAAKIIKRDKPVIVLEEKPLNHMPGDYTKPRQWLEQHFGYKLVGKVHKDVVLKI